MECRRRDATRVRDRRNMNVTSMLLPFAMPTSLTSSRFPFFFNRSLYLNMSRHLANFAVHCARGRSRGRPNMRRRPQTRGTPSTRRAGVSVSANPGATLGSLALFCNRDFSRRGKGECSAGSGRVRGPTESQDLLHSAFQGAINGVTERFEEAQSEYHLVTANSRDWHKWKGEMIA